MLVLLTLIACQNNATPTVTVRDGSGVFEGNSELTTTLTENLTFGETETAVLDDPDAAHNWLFQGTAGQTVTITVESPIDEADPAAVLLDPAGNVLIQEDDNYGPDEFDVQIVITLPQEGTYTVRVTTFDGGEYQITIQ
jgi:hypothetical protein